MTEQQALAYAEGKSKIGNSLAILREGNMKLTQTVKLKRAELMADIAAEKGGDGKAIYSNAEKREAELALREGPFVAGQLEEIRKNEQEITALQLEYEFARDMVNIACAFPTA